MKSEEVNTIRVGLATVAPRLERVEAIDARLAAIRCEARQTEGLLPRAEVEARLAALLRERREQFERGGADLRCLTGSKLVGHLSCGRPVTRDVNDSGDSLLGLLLWLLGPEVEQRAKAALARVEWHSGLGSEERVAVRASLEAERARLLAEREGLVDECVAAGVPVPHLPETEEARTQAAARERLEERARERQAEAEEFIEQRDRA